MSDPGSVPTQIAGDAGDLRPDDLPPRPLTHHLALTVYWLSNMLLWGALLHLAIQSRLIDWFGEVRVGYFFGILGVVGGMVGTVTQIVVGAFSDRTLHSWGRRRIYVLGGTIGAVAALLLLGAARSFWPFAGALVLVQVFSNTALGPLTALLPDTVNPQEHGKASGFMGLARLMGDTGGIVLAGQMLSVGHLQGASAEEITAFHDLRMFQMCVLMAGFMLLTMVVTCLTIKERRLRQRPEATAWQTMSRSFNVDLRGNVDFFWLSLSRAVTNVGFYMFLAIIPFFCKYSLKSRDPEQAAMLLQLPGIVAAALSSVGSGLLSDRIGRRVLIFVRAVRHGGRGAGLCADTDRGLGLRGGGAGGTGLRHLHRRGVGAGL